MNGFITFIDFETTGFGNSYATEIGLVAIDEQFEVTNQFQTLLKPPIPADAGALRVAGLSQRQLNRAPDFSEVWHLIEPFISGRVLVAHNSSFDMGVLNRELARMNLSASEIPNFCTLKNARTTWQLPDYKLGTIAQHLEVPKFQAHAALGDCLTTKHVFHHLVYQNKNAWKEVVRLGSLTVQYPTPKSSRGKALSR